MPIIDTLSNIEFAVGQRDTTSCHIAQSMNLIIGYTIYQLETAGDGVDIEVYQAVISLSNFVHHYHKIKLTGETNVQSTKK